MPRKRAPKGNGTIRLRPDGRWEARAPVGIDPGTGKTKFAYHYSKSEEEAAKWLRKTTASIDEQTYVEPEKMPLREWLAIWLAEYTGSIKPGTLKTYKSNVKLHITPSMGAVRLSELRPHDCQTFVNRLHRGSKTTSALSPKTVKNIHGTLHKALDTAVKVGYMRNNPADNVELPRIGQKEIRPLVGEEIDAFLQAIKDTPSEHLFFAALYTGMRLSELLGLQWKCVDLSGETIKVDKQLLLKRGRDTQREFGTPKNDKSRKIKVAPAVIDTLKAIKKQQAEWKLKAGEMWKNELDLVFTDALGNNTPHATIEHRYKRIVTAIGLPERRFHDLRHSYATESIRLGIPIKTISENLGHYSTAFTMDVYGFVTPQMENEAATRMQAAIMERMQKK